MAGRVLHIDVVRDRSAFLGLKPEWDALLARLGNCASVFMSHYWYDCWLRHFLGDALLQMVTFRRGRDLVGVAPLVLRRLSLHGLPVRSLGFPENGNSLHNDLIFGDDERELLLEGLLDHLFAARRDWDLLQFYRLPADSPNLLPLLGLLEQRGIRHQLRNAYASPFLNVAGCWEEFHASRSTRVRKTLRNVQNSLARAGSVEVLQLKSFEEFLRHRESLYLVARNSWTEEVGDSLASPANRPFFEELAERASEAGGLRVWLLLLDGRPIAFEYHLSGFGKQHALRASYDKEFASLSPGAFLEMEALKRIFEEPEELSRFDFGGSCDQYKKRWSGEARELVQLQAFNGEMYSRLCAFHTTRVVALARSLRDRLRRTE